MSRLNSWIRGKRMSDAVPEDIREHLEEKTADLMETGLPEQEARARARRELGNAAVAIESSAEVWGWVRYERLAQDMRHGLRRMVRNPGFTLVAVLCLSLGTGATTAIFSVVEAVLFRSLPYVQPNRLVRVFTELLAPKGDGNGQSPEALSKTPLTRIADMSDASPAVVFRLRQARVLHFFEPPQSAATPFKTGPAGLTPRLFRACFRARVGDVVGGSGGETRACNR